MAFLSQKLKNLVPGKSSGKGVVVQREGFMDMLPIFLRLDLKVGDWYGVVQNVGLKMRHYKRESKPVAFSASEKDMAQLTFSTLQANMVIVVAPGGSSLWRSNGVVPGATLTMFAGSNINAFSNRVDMMKEKYANSNGAALEVEFEVPVPYEANSDSELFIGAMSKFQLVKILTNCIQVKYIDDIYYIESEKFQEPGTLESLESWQPVKLKEGMRCIVMHDILGVLDMGEDEGDEEAEEVDIFSGSIVEIEKLNKKSQQAEVRICAEPDDKWHICISSIEGRPALRPSESTVIHQPLDIEHHMLEDAATSGFNYDDEELAAFASKNTGPAPKAAPKGRPKGATKKRAKAGAKAAAKSKAAAPAAESGKASIPLTKSKKLAKAKGRPATAPAALEDDDAAASTTRKSGRSKATTKTAATLSDDEGGGGGEPKAKAKGKAKAKKAAAKKAG
eukprot:GEMP01007464.1.p1 GENE.GEMP01007464.1~~GEMP01007464.1.p1  ORF type:complete len:449 (+),score=123.38 GEMP01007464.1:185-1531(+)